MIEDRQSRRSRRNAPKCLLATLAGAALPPLTKCAWNLVAGGKKVDNA
jgi:hypothetical protein